MLLVTITKSKREPRRTFTPDPDAIYLTDNGRALCGAHLGTTATYTGRDISGQHIHRLTASDTDWWQKHNMAGNKPMCEDCQKVWTK